MATNDEPFTRMATRIAHNVDTEFGGAVCIVPPKNSGDNIELLMLDAQGDPAQFWSTIATRIQIIMDGLRDKERVAATFGRR